MDAVLNFREKHQTPVPLPSSLPPKDKVALFVYSCLESLFDLLNVTHTLLLSKFKLTKLVGCSDFIYSDKHRIFNYLLKNEKSL